MLEQFTKLKPDNILDVVNNDLFIELDTSHDIYIKNGNYYE